jgi:NADPH:quinone reductase-like Zn-dependent oxidoreductase
MRTGPSRHVLVPPRVPPPRPATSDGTPELPATDLARLTGLAERGVLRACVDRTYPLEQLAEAHRYVEADHKAGSVVITL